MNHREFSCEHCGQAEREAAPRECDHCGNAMCRRCTDRHDEIDGCPVDPQLAASTVGPNQPAEDKAQAELYVKVCAQIRERGLQQFLDFLCEGARLGDVQIQLSCRPLNADDWPWTPVSAELLGERIFAKFFDIDLAAVERHRRRLLADMEASA